MNGNPHVLILPSWYPKSPGDIGGSFFREQAIALKKRGCKVGVLFPQQSSLRNWKETIFQNKGMTCINDTGINTYYVKSINIPKLKNVNKARWLAIGMKLFEKYIKENGLPDILLVLSLINAGFLANEISQKYSIPYVVTEHSTAFARKQVPSKTITELAGVVRNSSKNIAVSDEFKKLLNSIFNIDDWIFIPNIVNDDFFQGDITKYTNHKAFTFINVCLLDTKKRVDLLINAFSVGFKGNKNIQLVIGGDGPVRKTLEALVEEKGLTEQITFLGALTRDQVRRQVSKADAFVLSSEYETFGVVVIEALALGKPVIATRCGGPESIVVPEVGYLVDKNSVEKMAVAMKDLYENKKNFDGVKIRNYCEENFSEKAVTTKLIDIYSEVLDRNKHDAK
jgi:glycosyltransferase involved in cell wall biosynthesis